MKQLMKVQLYRLRKSTAGKWLVPVSLLSVILPTLYGADEIGYSNFHLDDALRIVDNMYMPLFCTFVIFAIIYSMKGAFDDRTICNEIMGGYSTVQIIFSRVVVVAGIAFLVSLSCLLLGLLCIWERFGTGVDSLAIPDYFDAMTRNELILFMIMISFEMLVGCVLAVLSMCMARETAAALAICWFLYLAAAYGVSFADLLYHIEPEKLSYFYSVLPGLAPALVSLIFVPDPTVNIKYYDENTFNKYPLLSIGDRLPLVITSGVILMVVFFFISLWILKIFEIRGKDDE